VGVGLSGTTGQITHHISPNVDAERDRLFRDIEQTGDLSEVYVVKGFHKILEGRNGGGDPWHTIQQQIAEDNLVAAEMIKTDPVRSARWWW
jgi:hypothetical protein